MTKKGSNAENKQATQSALLEAGVDLLTVPGVQIHELTAVNVTHRASEVGDSPYTIGDFHYKWDWQNDYRAALAAYVFGAEHDIDISAVTEEALAFRAMKAPQGEVKGVWSERLLGMVTSDRMFRPRQVIRNNIEAWPVVPPIDSAASLVQGYDRRLGGLVASSLGDVFGAEARPFLPEAQVLVCVAEDMAVRVAREQITTELAQSALSRLIPSV